MHGLVPTQKSNYRVTFLNSSFQHTSQGPFDLHPMVKVVLRKDLGAKRGYGGLKSRYLLFKYVRVFYS